MVSVTINVQKSEEPNDTQELATVRLPGVPRVGELVVAKGAEFVVREVCWFEDEDWVSLRVYSVKYG